MSALAIGSKDVRALNAHSAEQAVAEIVGRLERGESVALVTDAGTPAEWAEFLDAMATQDVPLWRMGRPDEVSGLVTFLLSDRASYITGASIDVAGGMGRYV